MDEPKTVSLEDFSHYTEEESIERARDFYDLMSKRRTVRDYSSREVAESIITDAIKTAGTAPSGANHQPWHFVAVKCKTLKKRIREAAEKEEYNFYKNQFLGKNSNLQPIKTFSS